MNRAELCLLRALGCAVRGEALEENVGLSTEEWQLVFRLAGMHHVLPLVFEAVHSLPELRTSPLLMPTKQLVRQQVFQQTRKTAEFQQLLQALEQAGVHPLVVKGLVCRSLYPKPDHRSSSDEDLLIRPEDLDACREVFARFGLTTDLPPERQEQVYEIPYRQRSGVLYIELHRHLFPPESDSYGHLNRFFRDAHQRAVRLSLPGGNVYSLSHTDHLFYLICHALKHFLHSGFGIRQVCDILMYAQTYGADIHWPTLLDNCRQIHALRFTAAIFRIGCNHLGFGPEVCPPELTAPEIDELPMLEDLLSAGVYGSSSMDRVHSSNITLEAAASRQQNRTSRNSLMLSLFPTAQKLEGSYPYLKDRPWLLPAAWASRISKYFRESLSRKRISAADSLKIGNERVALLEHYGILGDELS